MIHENLEVIAFKSINALHQWLLTNHDASEGIWVRLYKVKSGIESVTFHEVLEEGLCFGWSENLRHPLDDVSYLQRFTPRKAKKTTSERNINLVEKLEKENRMTLAGYKALGIPCDNLKLTK